ncbi:MAG: DinB family protein [Ignavibacteriales bacterium]|nr:DinB family protein [Ignavibacteriales bacterium]
MKKNEINPMPEYFDRYINLVDDIELDQAFEKSIEQLRKLDINQLSQLKGKRYLPDKWTVNDIFQHIIDVERILCVGVLRFARNESKYVISFDEDELSKNAKAEKKIIIDLIDELIIVRKSTISLYKSFDYSDYFKTGINWKHEISILAMGFNIIGHQIHHIYFIENKYYPLIQY